MIQLVVAKNGEEEDEKALPEILPILAIKNTVLFPGVAVPVTTKQQKSIRLAKKAYEAKSMLGVVARKKEEQEDIFHVGTIAKVIKVIRFSDGNTTIVLQGKQRFQIDEIVAREPNLLARIHILPEIIPKPPQKKVRALMQSLKEVAGRILKLSPEIPPEVQVALESVNNAEFLTYFLSSNISADVAYKQKLLEIDDNKERATLLLKYLLKDLEIIELKKEIQNKVHTDIDQQQRDYYLRQQIKVLQDELGDSGTRSEIEELRSRGREKKWPKEAADCFNRELEKAERLSPHAADYPILINHAELLVELPWGELTNDNFHLQQAEKVLNEDHYGLEKIKERILEYLAVHKLKQDMKGPILCLYGPPGVGKTSLGKSIAKAMNRKYVRMSLGGIHDEAEIRGHRKTYIGAMPGKIMQNIKKAKSSNPTFVLDEVDKMSTDFRGDPASALLEVLDPEQNNAFIDNFLEVPYDLSKVLFIATANSLDTIPHALRDRMEVIEVNGYTLEEKVAIAKKHLFPKQREEHGLKPEEVSIHEHAIVKVIEHYTRESGVRDLERKLGRMVRKVAKSIVVGEDYPRKIKKTDVTKLLGKEIFDQEIYQHNTPPGVAIGLAWTSVGGEILFIESSLSRGKGKLTLSGQLGEVMKESAITALSYLKSYADALALDYRVFENYNLHIHVPAGAVPKDGPSAGITLFTSLVSLYTQRKVKDKLAMTGEITLRGKVLPVGGLKEKILAAKRVGIKEIIVSAKNQKDIEEINQDYIKDLVFHYINDIEEVIQLALQPQKVSNAKEWTINLEQHERSGATVKD
ncbi:MAG: endopeptidase La [Cytophagales bacterium]|nr:endopeptidase La [Cytophagales bacterium]